MGTLLILVVLFIGLDIAAWYYGFDSTERIGSCEWKYRARWSSADRDQIESC